MNWIRQVQVNVGGLSFLGGTTQQTLRIRFKIEQLSTQSLGWADVIITNPSNAHRAALVGLKEGTEVTVDAGYENGNYGQIFKGQLVRVSTGKETPTETFAKIQAKDSDPAYNFAVVNKNLPANSTGEDYLKALVQSMSSFGVGLQVAPTQALQKLVYPRGLALFGPTKEYLRQLSHSVNSTWCLQRGQLQMVPLDGHVGGPWQVNSQTGMISIPIQTLTGVIVRTLLNPAMNVNDLIQLNPSDIASGSVTQDGFNPTQQELYNQGQLYALNPSGLYRIIKLEFSGDTRAPAPWFNDIITISQSASSAFTIDIAPPTIQTGANTVNIMRD